MIADMKQQRVERIHAVVATPCLVDRLVEFVANSSSSEGLVTEASVCLAAIVCNNNFDEEHIDEILRCIVDRGVCRQMMKRVEVLVEKTTFEDMKEDDLPLYLRPDTDDDDDDDDDENDGEKKRSKNSGNEETQEKKELFYSGDQEYLNDVPKVFGSIGKGLIDYERVENARLQMKCSFGHVVPYTTIEDASQLFCDTCAEVFGEDGCSGFSCSSNGSNGCEWSLCSNCVMKEKVACSSKRPPTSTHVGGITGVLRPTTTSSGTYVSQKARDDLSTREKNARQNERQNERQKETESRKQSRERKNRSRDQSSRELLSSRGSGTPRRRGVFRYTTGTMGNSQPGSRPTTQEISTDRASSSSTASMMEDPILLNAFANTKEAKAKEEEKEEERKQKEEEDMKREEEKEEKEKRTFNLTDKDTTQSVLFKELGIAACVLSPLLRVLVNVPPRKYRPIMVEPIRRPSDEDGWIPRRSLNADHAIAIKKRKALRAIEAGQLVHITDVKEIVKDQDIVWLRGTNVGGKKANTYLATKR